MSEQPHWNAPVLRSVTPVIERSHHVATSPEAVERVAAWMAYEDFRFPRTVSSGAFPLGDDPERAIDLTMLISTMNFAFTDFDSGVKFTAERDGQIWTDSEGMFACLHNALDDGVPVLDGAYLASITREQLARVFRGSIEMPMLDERVEILKAVGRTLVDGYDGRFHRFVRSCAPAMYAGGDGLLERLVVEFPRFDDVSTYHGHQVQLFKLAQLALWALRSADLVKLEDLELMTAFADYIVPLALQVMGILVYHPDLQRRIDEGVLIARDSDEEIEIRAHTVYATALLTDALNARRPDDRQLYIPQLDYRLWSTYHATFRPHHLTRTIMY